MIILLILGIILLLEILLKPRLDSTRDGKILLWYNNIYGVRNYKIIYYD